MNRSEAMNVGFEMLYGDRMNSMRDQILTLLVERAHSSYEMLKKISPGFKTLVFYSTLLELEDEKKIVRWEEPGGPERGGRPRAMYRLSDAYMHIHKALIAETWQCPNCQRSDARAGATWGCDLCLLRESKRLAKVLR